MESDRCLKCGAPVGTGATRCPLCGADTSGQGVNAPAFQPAIVGMKQPRTFSSSRKVTSESNSKNLILAMVAIAGLLLIAGLGYAGYRMIAVKHVPIASAPTSQASSPTPLTLEGVAIADPMRADPTDLLPAARKRITEGSMDYRLVEISLVRGRAGVVNLTQPGSQIIFRYLYEQNDPRVDKKNLKRERVDLTLRESSPSLERAKAVAGDDPVQDPLCVWSAAWRAAVASGFNPEAEFEARYARRPKADKPDKGSWTINAIDKLDSKVEIDGISCAIRSSK